MGTVARVAKIVAVATIVPAEVIAAVAVAKHGGYWRCTSKACG